MSNNQIERQDGDQHDARLMAIKKNADPQILKPFLKKYQGKFIVIPEDRSAYFIEGSAKVAFQDIYRLRNAEEIARYISIGSEITEYDGVSAIAWTLLGPSKTYPNNQAIAIGGGRKESYLAGRFHNALESKDAQVIELPEDLAQLARTTIAKGKDNEIVLPPELSSFLYAPIHNFIDQIHDEYWTKKLITYEDVLLLPQGTTPAIVHRTWYLQPPTRATETIDHTLYFISLEYSTQDGKTHKVRAVEKAIVVHTQEERDKYGTALNNPLEMVKKQQFMKSHGIPTYKWAYANETDTKLFVPDLTERDSEVLDHRIYVTKVHPEKYQNERLVTLDIPDWVNEYTDFIDEQADAVVRLAEEMGMEILKDCLYIVKPKGNLPPKVLVGDLGQGLFHPDDPNKGKVELRYTL